MKNKRIRATGGKKFDSLMRALVGVPKAEVEAERAKYADVRQTMRSRKKSA